jgi:pantothenate kinase
MIQDSPSDPQLAQKLAEVSGLRARLLAAHGAKPRVTLDEAAALACDHWRAAGRRVIVGLGGGPASGKTTAAGKLARMLAGRGVPAVHLPMDGYHFSNARLKQLDLEGIKGDLRTFDVAAYRDKLAEFKGRPDAPLTAPDYVRAIHDVVPDAVAIPAETAVLVTEGIYVGYPHGLWADVRACLDLLLYLDTPPEDCVARVTRRNAEAGRDAAMIRHKVGNDLGFMTASLQILPQADAVLTV